MTGNQETEIHSSVGYEVYTAVKGHTAVYCIMTPTYQKHIMKEVRSKLWLGTFTECTKGR
jgi:hypothetical protein